MKNLLLLLVLASVSGCVSTPAGSPAPVASTSTKQIAPFVTQLAQSGVPLVLNKNPKYAPVVKVVATAIPAAFAAGNLDATSISNTIALIGQKNGLSSEACAAISAALLDGVTWYQATYGVSVANAADPNVVVLLNSFASGLNNGVILWENSQPKA
jgi:hypothetical protein